MAENSAPAQKKGLGLVVALLIIVLAVSAYFMYSLYQQNEDLKKTNASLEAKANSSDSIVNQVADEQKVIANSNAVVVNMVGTKAAPTSSANVYWDTAAASVFLVVKNMPQLDVTKEQYQLWALIDGKPTGLGVFDAKNNKTILKMKDTKKADAFAITIEKQGGSQSPTLEKMQSSGKAKGL